MNSKYNKQTLANGIRLITVPIPQAKSVTAMVLVKVGSRYEEERIAGISHFLEHMPFKGTKKYPTALKLSSAVDSIGADFNAFTSKEYTGFYVKAGNQHLDLALDVLSQLIWQALLPKKEIEKEKGVIVEEINMREDMPMAKVSEEFEILLYGKTSLGRETIGYKQTVRSLKRQNFLDFKNKWYRPARMVIGIVGGINNGTMKQSSFAKATLDKWDNETMGQMEQMEQLVKRYFTRAWQKAAPSDGADECQAEEAEKLPLGSPALSGQGGFTRKCNTQATTATRLLYKHAKNKRKLGIKKLTFNQEKPALRVKYKKTEQTHFCLGVRALPRGHKDRYVLALLATILGGNMSSRLFTEVREKRGLAYYVKTDIETYFDNGYLVSQAGTDIGKAGEAMKVILEEYVKVSKVDKVEKVEKELRRAKEYLKGKLALALEDSKEIASLYVEGELLENKIRTPEEIIAGVEKVTVADIQRLAKQLFVSQGLNLAIIGPYKDKEKFAKILKL